MRISFLVRKILLKHGCSIAFTNCYKHTRSVKCYNYSWFNLEAAKAEIKQALPDVPGLNIRVVSHPWKNQSVIISWPKELVDLPTYL